MENFKINGFTDSHSQCDRCGKSELKGTYHITTDLGQDFHIGSSCIKSAWQMTSKEFDTKWFAPYKQRLSLARDEFFTQYQPTSTNKKEDWFKVDNIKKSLASKYGLKSYNEI